MFFAEVSVANACQQDKINQLPKRFCHRSGLHLVKTFVVVMSGFDQMTILKALGTVRYMDLVCGIVLAVAIIVTVPAVA